MRTETKTFEIYTFEELPKEVQNKIIERQRNKYYEYNNFNEWVVDDCSLLEPPPEELKNIQGYNNLKKPLFNNNRNKI